MKYIHSLYIGLLSLLFVGCQEEQLNNMQTGGFQISLQDVAADITTKTLPKDLEGPIVSNFHLKITNENNGISAYDGAYISDLIPASTGVYSITATHGDNPPLAKDNPYYKGDTTGVKLEEDQVASVELKCRVANALASVVYTSEAMFKEVFTDYGVKVGIGNLTLDLENGTTESAYYQAGSIPTFTFVGTLKGNGKEVTKVLEDTKLTDPSTFAAGQHCKITLSLSTTTSGLNLHIEKVEATPVTITATIPMEWLPKPKVEAEGFIDDTLTFVETETPEASIKLSTASALQDMRLKFHFEDPQFEALNRDTGYLYSNPADKDIINTTLGISLSDENKIDLSSLLTKLQTKAGETTNNSIEIDAKANNRWSSEEIEGQETPNLKYTLTCEKPEFTVSAYPGNIWTKEFTMNALMEDQVTEGDFSKLSANMKYQFSTNGESDWTDLGEDLRKADLTPGATYYIRGVYRGEVCSDPVAVSTYPIIELENGNMEDWDFEITDNERNPITKNTNKIYWKKWFPWKSVSVSTIWNTVNQTTTQDGNAPGLFWGTPTPPYVGCCYVANSGTIPVEGGDAHSGKSALLKTVGWGSGSTAGGDASDIKHVTPAELYLGTYDLPNHQPIYGIDYNSRPTAMKFWCKYIPKSTDLLIAQINILDSEGTIIGRANIASEEAGATDWTERILPIEYTDLSKAPKKMYIVFKSGSLTNTDIMDKPAFGNLSDAESVGSKLYVDDVSLVYDK